MKKYALYMLGGVALLVLLVIGSRAIPFRSPVGPGPNDPALQPKAPSNQATPFQSPVGTPSATDPGLQRNPGGRPCEWLVSDDPLPRDKCSDRCGGAYTATDPVTNGATCPPERYFCCQPGYTVMVSAPACIPTCQ
jgi:hypothetical protein